MVDRFLNVSMKTSLLPGYVLDYTLDDDTADGDNCINDSNDDENCNYDNNENNNSNHLVITNNNNDNNDSNHDNNNDDQAIMIFQTMYFVEPFICKKADFLAFTHICVNTCVFIVRTLSYL